MWTPVRETNDQQAVRARKLLSFLHNMSKEKGRVALVAHDSILRAIMTLLRDVPGTGMDMYEDKAFFNCEKRVYNIPLFDVIANPDDDYATRDCDDVLRRR